MTLPTDDDDVCRCADLDGLTDPEAVHYIGCPMASPAEDDDE